MGLKEKEINLSVSLFIEDFLSEESDTELIYTRSKDEFYGLKERAVIANKADADLYVSIHCNSSENTEVNGVETYVIGMHKNEEDLNIADEENKVVFLEKKSHKTYNNLIADSTVVYTAFKPKQKEYLDKSKLIAQKVQNNLTDNLNRSDRGVKQAKFLVLNEVDAPGIIIKLGYLSNIDESYFLTSIANQKKLAKEISKAIIEFKDMTMYDKSDIIDKEDVVEESIVVDDVDDAVNVNTTDIIINTSETGESGDYVETNDVVDMVKTADNTGNIDITETVKTADNAGNVHAIDPVDNVTNDDTLDTVDSLNNVDTADKVDSVNNVDTGDNADAIEKVDSIDQAVMQKLSKPTYYVQIMAVDEKLDLTPENFNGLEEITSVNENNTFKYRFGKSKSYLEILDYLTKARRQGFRDAYVVAYLGDKKIPIQEAFKMGS